MRLKCVDPCIETCGENALCRVHHHSPYCTCIEGYDGDPFIRCTKENKITQIATNPCSPNPCGMYSYCQEVQGSASCSCKPGYFGVPPRCSPECTINEDCSRTKACVREKCVDPCIGSCGINTDCRAYDHLAICSCLPGYKGDPFIGCYVMEKGILILLTFYLSSYLPYVYRSKYIINFYCLSITLNVVQTIFYL